MSRYPVRTLILLIPFVSWASAQGYGVDVGFADTCCANDRYCYVDHAAVTARCCPSSKTATKPAGPPSTTARKPPPPLHQPLRLPVCAPGPSITVIGNDDDDNNGADASLSDGAKAGIGAGVAVGVSAVTASLTWLWLSRRRRAAPLPPPSLAARKSVPAQPQAPDDIAVPVEIDSKAVGPAISPHDDPAAPTPLTPPPFVSLTPETPEHRAELYGSEVPAQASRAMRRRPLFHRNPRCLRL
ncbi:unnamed protein product [Parascedosporium putredinis]|uniref:Uncharacterized protein n=1 Tax=Parascedosporium putredinis TaxID=1442378 RepID=A0A9P1MBY3_9PEZI|nr:unnamed protein product [Parascedosporium putredinis]CAI7995642.1 unnamed protein product [Parascedosporium putredinis]